MSERVLAYPESSPACEWGSSPRARAAAGSTARRGRAARRRIAIGDADVHLHAADELLAHEELVVGEHAPKRGVSVVGTSGSESGIRARRRDAMPRRLGSGRELARRRRGCSGGCRGNDDSVFVSTTSAGAPRNVRVEARGPRALGGARRHASRRAVDEVKLFSTPSRDGLKARSVACGRAAKARRNQANRFPGGTSALRLQAGSQAGSRRGT